jgi:hypothetical protein
MLNVCVAGHVVRQPGAKRILSKVRVDSVHAFSGIIYIRVHILCVECRDRFGLKKILARSRDEQRRKDENIFYFHIR